VEKPRVKQLIEWMAEAATTAEPFLLTGRLYWLFGCALFSKRQFNSLFTIRTGYS
jgi:hypothetical protein